MPGLEPVDVPLTEAEWESYLEKIGEVDIMGESDAPDYDPEDDPDEA